MKKVIAGVAVAGVMALSMGISAVPASAGSDNQKVQFCHSNEGSKGFTYNDTSISAVVDVKTGLPKGHGVDTKDIIPKFDWVYDGVRYYFDGMNLDKVGYINKDAGSCSSDAPDLVVVTPKPPVYIAPACPSPANDRFGRVDTSNPGDGVVSPVEAVFNSAKAEWTVTYQLKADTSEINYEWANGENGKYTIKAKDLHDDPLYVIDSRTHVGGCELSNTGAGDIALWGGLGALGLLAGVGAVVVTRRKNA